MDVNVMGKQLVIIGITLVLLAVGLSGCTNNENQVKNTLTPEKNRFIGTWINTSTSGKTNIIIFYLNGTFSAPLLQQNGAWDVKNNTLVYKGKATNGSEYTFKYTYIFSNNNRTLAVTDIDSVRPTVIYTKQ